MSEEVTEVRATLGTGKTVTIAGERWVISRDDAPVQFVDIPIEARQHNSVVYLTLGQTVMDEGCVPQVVIACRLRMSLATAQVVRDVLNERIQAAFKPVDQSKAN